MDPHHAPERALLRREAGGIDLPSTTVSVLVIAAFLAAAALAVFVVIPWSQNNAAKHLVSQIVSAQSTYYSMSADGSVGGTGRYRAAEPKLYLGPHYAPHLSDLQDADLLGDGIDSAKVLVRAWNRYPGGPTGGDLFKVEVHSDTGRAYYADQLNPTPVEVPPGTVVFKAG